MSKLSLRHGLEVGLIEWTERPGTWIERPTCSTYRDLLARNTTMDFMHPWIKMSVKREAEMCQTQAGPAGLLTVSFKPTQPPTAIERRSGASTRRSAQNGKNLRPAGPTLWRLELIFAWKLRQPTFLRTTDT